MKKTSKSQIAARIREAGERARAEAEARRKAAKQADPQPEELGGQGGTTADSTVPLLGLNKLANFRPAQFRPHHRRRRRHRRQERVCVCVPPATLRKLSQMLNEFARCERPLIEMPRTSLLTACVCG